MLLVKSNDLGTAEECLGMSVMIDPTLPVANYYLSLVHIQMRDYQTAESDLLYENDITPRHEAVLYQLGRSFEMELANI